MFQVVNVTHPTKRVRLDTAHSRRSIDCIVVKANSLEGRRIKAKNFSPKSSSSNQLQFQFQLQLPVQLSYHKQLKLTQCIAFDSPHNRFSMGISQVRKPNPRTCKYMYREANWHLLLYHLGLDSQGYNVSVNGADKENAVWTVLVARRVPGGHPINVLNKTCTSLENVILELGNIGTRTF